jgi:hypothetical protein
MHIGCLNPGEQFVLDEQLTKVLYFVGLIFGTFFTCDLSFRIVFHNRFGILG